MKVQIFKNILSENNPSMHIYANDLLMHMPDNVKSFSIAATNYPFVKYYFVKEFIYPKIAAKNQADVNHITDHSYCGLLRNLNPKKTVVTCHDLIPLIDPASASWFGKRRFWFNVRLLPDAANIIAISKFTKQIIMKVFGKGLENKISVIPYGVSRTFRSYQDTDSLRQKYNISKKSILHVGSSYQRKNVELILEVIARRKDWQFIKVGPFSKRQLAYIKKNNLNKRIVHFPFIDLTEREKLAKIYNCAGILAYPSFYEGFGMPILEAMACRCPVACSDIAPFVEIAGGAAVFFNPKDIKLFQDSIERLLEDEDFKNELVRKGFAIAKRHSWKDCARQTYKIYEEVYKKI